MSKQMIKLEIKEKIKVNALLEQQHLESSYYSVICEGKRLDINDEIEQGRIVYIISAIAGGSDPQNKVRDNIKKIKELILETIKIIENERQSFTSKEIENFIETIFTDILDFI